MHKPLCALTMGDPAGVGPEVILKTLFSHRANVAARMIVVGFPAPFRRDAAVLNLDVAINEIDDPAEAVYDGSTVNMIIPDASFEPPLAYGIVDAGCGKAAALPCRQNQ